MEKKKTSFMILGVCALVLSVIGVTYAFWQLRLAQKDQNTIGSSCFDVELIDEKDAIQLEKAYPILDEEASSLKPYKFTITNKCATNASYQINLEALSQYGSTTIAEGIRLRADYIRAQLNEVNKDTEEETEIEKEIVNLTQEIHVNPTLNDEEAKSYDAFKLATGYLGPNESKSFALRIWLDGKLTMENQDAMNKTFASKITVTTSYLSETQMKPQVDLELALCENNIIAQGKATPFGNRNIDTYEFKLDDSPDWDTSESLTKSYTVEPGSHTISLKVTDNTGVVSEIQKTIEAPNYVDPTTAELGGQTIDLVTSGNGLYKVGHCDVTGTVDDIGFSKEEYRYAGANYKDDSTDYVHNYVWFNCEEGYPKSDEDNTSHCEKWRIIGLVNVKTERGNIEQRLKLIKNESIGRKAWDSGNNNDWTKASLMTELNENYYQNTLTDTASKGMIAEDIIWNIGRWSTSGVKTAAMYGYERGTTTGNGNTNPSAWPNGKIGLMYPSDYGYAVGGESRRCIDDTVLGNYEPCKTNNWLALGSADFTLTSASSNSSGVFFVLSVGDLTWNRAEWSNAVRPVVYLSESVKIVDNDSDGSYEKPYALLTDSFD